jgi:hypothetical protein
MSTLARVLFDPDITPPSAPGGVAASAPSTSTIRITWNASTDTGGSGLSGYRIYRSTTSGGTYSLLAQVSVASLVYDDFGLGASTTRYYRVSAFDGNNNESAQSVIVSATTQSTGGSTGDLQIPADYTIYWAAPASLGGNNSNSGLSQGSPKLLSGVMPLLDGPGKGVYVLGDESTPNIDLTNPAPVWQQSYSPAGSGSAAAPIIIQGFNPRRTTLQGRVVGAEHTRAISVWFKDNVHCRYMRIVGAGVMRGDESNPTVGSAFIGCDVVEGDIEGDDVSLHWGLGFVWVSGGIMRDCRVHQMSTVGNASDNTGCFELFASSDCVVEYCYADSGNVFSGIGFKAGNCDRNRLRYFTVKNSRDGFGGSESVGINLKANTVYVDTPGHSEYRPCLDNVVEYGIIENCIDAIMQRHGCKNTIIQHISSRECDGFIRDWQLSNTNLTSRSNIFVPRAAVSNPRCYYKEALVGTNFAPYISSSNNNRWPSGTTRFAGSSNTTLTQATWTSGQSMTNRDQSSTNTDPNWVDAANGNYQPQAAAVLGTAHDGTHMGAWQSGVTRFKPYWMS